MHLEKKNEEGILHIFSFCCYYCAALMESILRGARERCIKCCGGGLARPLIAGIRNATRNVVISKIVSPLFLQSIGGEAIFTIATEKWQGNKWKQPGNLRSHQGFCFYHSWSGKSDDGGCKYHKRRHHIMIAIKSPQGCFLSAIFLLPRYGKVAGVIKNRLSVRLQSKGLRVCW